MCWPPGSGDVPAEVVQRALDDNLYLNEFPRMPPDYQPRPIPKPKKKPGDTPGPPGFYVPDLDL